MLLCIIAAGSLNNVDLDAGQLVLDDAVVLMVLRSEDDRNGAGDRFVVK